MARAVQAFKEIELGPETSDFTAVTPDVRILGTLFGPTTEYTTERPEYDSGSLSMHQGGEGFRTQTLAPLVLEQHFNFRDFAYWASAAVLGNVSASGADPYTWTFEPSLTSTTNVPAETNGIDTLTFRYGEDLQVYETEGVFVDQMEISWDGGESPVMIRLQLLGRQVSDASFADIAAPSITRAPGNKCQLHIDSSYANLGTTEKADTLRGFRWIFNPNFTPIFTGDNQIYFNHLQQGKFRAEFRPRLEWNTTSESERDNFESTPNPSQTYLQITIQSETANRTLTIGGSYEYEEFPEPEDQDDGTRVVEPVAYTVEDGTANKQFTLTLTNGLSAL